jgi:hypothetical protein
MYVYLIWIVPPKIYGMTKMPKMQKIPNLPLLVNRDDQLAYFILLTLVCMEPCSFCSPIVLEIEAFNLF